MGARALLKDRGAEGLIDDTFSVPISLTVSALGSQELKGKTNLPHMQDKPVLIEIGLALSYWLFEALVINTLFFGENLSIESFWPSEPIELWMRFRA